MKSKIIKLSFLLVVILLIWSCVGPVYRTPPPPAPPMPPPRTMHADIAIFYDDLALYGEWIWMDIHGWIWIPKKVPLGWRPYTHGRWIYSDHGLTWVSKWKWGWAPFHYGRWVYDPYYGWIWIPGKRWAPAWVVWRYGKGWIGWAPLPPDVHWQVGIGLNFGNVNIDVMVEPFWWCFVAERQLLHSNVHTRIIPSARNVTIVKVTNHVTKYVAVENRVVNKSISIDQIRKAVGGPFTHYEIIDLDSKSLKAKGVKGKKVHLYRPAIEEAPPGLIQKKEEVPKVKKTPPPKEEIPSRPGKISEKKVDIKKPPLSPELLKHQELEMKRMESHHKKRIAELERVHQKQMRQAMSSDESIMELRKQQKAEQQALKEQIKREKQVLKKRHEQQKKKASSGKSDESKQKEKKKDPSTKESSKDRSHK